jgi:hypothetical protein
MGRWGHQEQTNLKSGINDSETKILLILQKPLAF